MRLRLTGDFLNVEAIFTAVQPSECAREKSLREWHALLSEKDLARHRMLHVDQFAELADKARGEISAGAGVSARVEFLRKSKQIGKKVAPNSDNLRIGR